MDSKAIGEVDALHDTLDNVPFHVYCMKEPDYVMMIMSTYGKNEQGGEEKHCDANGNRLSFKYPE
eukprot:13461131-Ditylum_brightwellii.AAC.1